MTDEQIIELLATKVMGWCKHQLHPDLPDWYLLDKDLFRFKMRGDWNPLVKIDDAWMVVEKLGRWHGFNFMIMYECWTWRVGNPLFWTVGWFEEGYEGPESRCSAESETVTRAICLAALKAHGIEV